MPISEHQGSTQRGWSKEKTEVTVAPGILATGLSRVNSGSISMGTATWWTHLVADPAGPRSRCQGTGGLTNTAPPRNLQMNAT